MNNLTPPYETFYAYAKRHRSDFFAALLWTALITCALCGLAVCGMNQKPYLDWAQTQADASSADILPAMLSRSSSMAGGYFLLLFPACLLLRWFPPQSRPRAALLSGLTALTFLFDKNMFAPLSGWLERENILYALWAVLPVWIPVLLYAVPRFIRTVVQTGEYQNRPWLVKGCVFYGAGWACYLLMTCQMTDWKAIKPDKLPYNLAYWPLLLLFLYLLTSRLKLSLTACLVISWIIGAANAQLYTWRGDYIMPSDLSAIGTALNVADHYRLSVTAPTILTLLALILLLRLLWRPSFHVVTWKPPAAFRVVKAAGLTALLAFYVVCSFHMTVLYASLPENQFNNVESAKENGYLVTFLASLRALQPVTPPEGYTGTETETILSRYKPAKSSGTAPDIILIQNESFCDLRILSDIETDKPIFPYIDALPNAQKGYAAAPTANGPTACSEFEVLTRCSMRFLPSGGNPFTMYLNRDTVSLASVLKRQETPYRSVVFHPYYASGYDRPAVYQYLGFDDQIFYENWPEKETLRGLVTDKQDFSDLISIYEQTMQKDPETPVFLFNITIQNHGSYFGDAPAWNDPVAITNFDAMPETQIYVNLMHETDQALPLLIDYFQKSSRPVLLCMYGDHQAFLNPDAKEQLLLQSVLDPEEQEKRQLFVPYLIWANYEIPSIAHFGEDLSRNQYGDFSLNFLGSYILRLAGVSLSPFDQYLLDLHQKYPVLTTNMICTKNGTEFVPETAHGADEIQKYAAIQYDLLFETKKEPFFVP